MSGTTLRLRPALSYPHPRLRSHAGPRMEPACGTQLNDKTPRGPPKLASSPFVNTRSPRANFRRNQRAPRLDGPAVFRCRPGPPNEKTCLCNKTSICSTSNLPQKGKPIGILGGQSHYTPRSELQTKEDFWKVWPKRSCPKSESEDRLPVESSRAKRSRAGIRGRNLARPLVYAGTRRAVFPLERAPAFSAEPRTLYKEKAIVLAPREL